MQKVVCFGSLGHDSVALVLLYNMSLEPNFTIEQLQRYTASQIRKISVQPTRCSINVYCREEGIPSVVMIPYHSTSKINYSLESTVVFIDPQFLYHGYKR